LGSVAAGAGSEQEDARDAKAGYPLSLRARLPLFEVQDEGARLRKRAADVQAWLGSPFVAKAKELAESELVKAVQQRKDGCTLGLASLEKYIRKDLKVQVTPSQKNGAFFTREPLWLEPGECSDAMLMQALFDILKECLTAWCTERHLQLRVLSELDQHHGLVMYCAGLAPDKS